ncbi:hypothetical protein [Streptacidiphilus sp. PAMC 29251]
MTAAAGLLLLAACAAQPGATRSQDAPPPQASATSSSSAAVLPDSAAGSAAGSALGSASGPGVNPATGLASSADGYWLVSATAEPTAVRSIDYRFQVLAPDGSAVSSFLGGDDTARVYAVRSDLTGLRRTVPDNLGEGVWSASLGELDPGLWRIFVAFTPNSNPGPSGRPPRLLLSRTLTVPGTAETSPLDPVSATASVDGLTLHLGGRPVAGRAAVLRLTVTRPTVQGMAPNQRTVEVPVGSLEPLDGAFAQLTAARAGDLALAPFTALTPAIGTTGGPSVTFRGTFPEPGDWRVFVQFRTEGQEHTATFTVRVR